METHFIISATMEGLILHNPNPYLSKTPFLHSAFRPQITPNLCCRTLSFSVTCKVKASQDKKPKNVSNKIVLSEAAPPLAEESDDNNGNNTEAEVKSGNGSGLMMKLVKRLPKRILGALSNLPLAIGEMFTIAALMALGMTYFCWLYLSVFGLLIWIE